MALTSRVIFSSYPYNGQGNPADGTSGRSENLPAGLTKFYAAPAGTMAGDNVSIASFVELLPTGVRNYSIKYATPSTVAQLQSNGT